MNMTLGSSPRASLGLIALGAAVFLFGLGDALARPGLGDGRLAHSSVSGANRAMPRANGGNRPAGNNRPSGGFNGNGNRNRVNIGNDVNINIDRGYNQGHHNGYHDNYHPIARGIVIGAVAATTAAVIGSSYYALPPSGCTVVIRNGLSYSRCGSVYYEQIWSGGDVVYVVVDP